MSSDESATGSPHVPFWHVNTLPIALYELNGNIYEVYQGGQARQFVRIRWERLKTITVTRANAALKVQVSQGERERPFSSNTEGA